MKHCQGHEFAVASVPPTMRAEVSGLIAGMPHDAVTGADGCWSVPVSVSVPVSAA